MLVLLSETDETNSSLTIISLMVRSTQELGSSQSGSVASIAGFIFYSILNS